MRIEDMINILGKQPSVTTTDGFTRDITNQLFIPEANNEDLAHQLVQETIQTWMRTFKQVKEPKYAGRRKKSGNIRKIF